MKTWTKRLGWMAAVAALALASGGCGSDDGGGSDDGMSGEQQQQTLYDKYGGRPTIQKLVDDFIGVVAADTRINAFFADTAADPARLSNLNKQLVDQLCEALGGPEKYTGKDMVTAHKGMGVTDADFDALVEDLVQVLSDNGVEAADIEAIGSALAPMRAQIVVEANQPD